jgi:TolB protein
MVWVSGRLAYVTRLVLRLAAIFVAVACLCLGAAKVWGVGFNHSPILVYAASAYSQTPSQYPLFLVDIQRNLFTRLRTRDLYGGTFPACSVTGKIAFTSLGGNARVNSADIYVMDITGSSALQVTHEFGSSSLLSWSPDGQHLAFVSASSSTPPDIYVVDLMGGAPQPITRQDYIVEPPKWSPDGRQLLFVSFRDRHTDIYTVSLDDDTTRRLTDNDASEQWPVWSPDGSRIAFSSNQTGDFDIYVMDSDGTNLHQLTQSGANEYFPVWSPDGTQIAFTDYERGQLHLMDADGSNRRVLSDSPPSFHEAVWSSDGQYLAVIAQVYGNRDIYLLSINGSIYKPLSRTGASYASIAWCP